jgi:23S rRNA (cytosine1962-C5)-methyltransferase
VSEENIYTRLRKRKQGRYAQYEKVNEVKEFFTVQENGLNFLVNLTDYLDTGLFLDHRITRQMVRLQSAGKRVLNLFCYTGAFSVYAAAGNAKMVTSVDLSKTYLQWAQDNFAVNNFKTQEQYSFIHADVMQYLQALQRGSFDIIIADPPTFSNSKRMKDFFDVQRDYALLINLALRALAPNGMLYFSTNYTRFILDKEKLDASHIKDITNITTPFDFEGKLKRYCFLIEK